MATLDVRDMTPGGAHAMTRAQHWGLVSVGAVVIAIGYACDLALPQPIGAGLCLILAMTGGFIMGRFWP